MWMQIQVTKMMRIQIHNTVSGIDIALIWLLSKVPEHYVTRLVFLLRYQTGSGNDNLFHLCT
jgi:hypothetical protein